MPLTPAAGLVARMPRVLLVLVLALVLGALHAPSGGSAAQDSDGDGIPDAVDPDDDNDGTLDNPHSGGAPAGDSDEDTIPDAVDPDDNNNQVFDRDEPDAPSPPPATGGSSGGSGGGGNQSAPERDDAPTVFALPVTGIGPAGEDGPGAGVVIALAGWAVMGLLAGWRWVRAERG